ncbi:pilus assembly protein [Burkholderia multivorans]|uniref:pilus assembly protein n=1 Tax=Burkholderia multivorans TaxID=87883 RepID=UPI002B24A7D7|nr:pilus assembly protein [Burkholderia multivorans]MEB2487992.1 pilus assembly protein [Burkholderia multivorans]MEB2570111.1 pilus assembly protein [Burkholderia multivorans]
MTTIAISGGPLAAAWPRIRRRVSPTAMHAAGCASAFAAVLAGGIHLSNAADWSGLARSGALLQAAQTRVADLERVLETAAPQRNARQLAAAGEGTPPVREWGALMFELVDLVASSGLHVVSVEPLKADRAVADGRRTVRLVAAGEPAAPARAIGALADFSVLAVPATLRVERGPDGVRIDMSVDVFPTLPGIASSGAATPALDGDPFGSAEAFAMADGRLPRLVGLIRDMRSALVLFDDGDGGFTAVRAGDALGALRVARVDAGAVTLSTSDGPRRLALEDGGRS